MSPAKKKKPKAIEHPLIGFHVWFRGSMWKVIGAHLTQGQVTPWLTLKRNPGITTVAKTDEVKKTLN